MSFSKKAEKKPSEEKVEAKVTHPLPPLQPTPFPNKDALFIEVAGPPKYGKTHFTCTFPKPAMADTEGKGWRVLQKFNNSNWFRIEKFSELRQFVNSCILNDEIETLIFDSGSDLREMAEKEWCEEQGKERVYPIVLYGQVYSKIDNLFREIRKAEKHLATTSRMKDVYLGEQKTGVITRDGYKKVPYQADITIELVKGIYDDDLKLRFPEYVFGKINENTFVKPGFSKPILLDLSFQGIQNELLDPWYKGIDDILFEAEKRISEAKQLKAPI